MGSAHLFHHAVHQHFEGTRSSVPVHAVSTTSLLLVLLECALRHVHVRANKLPHAALLAQSLPTAPMYTTLTEILQPQTFGPSISKS